MRTTLMRFNRAGFLTINSQPAQNCVRSDHPERGWGPSGGYLYQKAYLELFCSPERWEELHESFKQFPGLTFHAINAQGDAHSNCNHVNAVTWGVFAGREILQPTVVDPVSFSAWKEEAYGLWKVWGSIYEKKSISRMVLEKIRTEYWLVNIVDNDFVEGSSAFDGLGNIYKIIDGLIVDGPSMLVEAKSCESPVPNSSSP